MGTVSCYVDLEHWKSLAAYLRASRDVGITLPVDGYHAIRLVIALVWADSMILG